MTTFGSTTEDIDRGPPEEDRRTPAELRGDMKDIANARASIGEKATIRGLQESVTSLKEMVHTMTDQHNKLINLYSTLRGEFDQFQKQRAIELQSWLADGGSTTPEDNGDNS